MNTSTIQLPSPPQVSWSTTNAQEKDADFLRLRLLNKRTRIRISPRPLDLNVYDGNGNYFVASNLKGWFTAIVQPSEGEYRVVSSPLKDLRESILSSTTEGEDDFLPKRAVSVSGVPVHLALALNDERLVVGFADGSISIYESLALFSQGEGSIDPLRTFPPAPPGAIRQILGNPGDLPELVAVRRDARSGADGIAVEVLNVKTLHSVGGWQTDGTPGSVPTSITWSAKGKQLAIGLKSGDIVTYSPTDTNSPKLHVPRAPSAGDGSAISVLWLSNQTFYVIYSPAGDMSPETVQKHIVTQYDPKANVASQIELETPYYPSPALKPPGAFTVVMRNWNPARLLIFVADSTSSDIGLVGSIAETMETWCNLALEETSTPSVPLDKDAEDTVPLALDMDLTSGQGEQVATASPILYLYASDGTLQAWFVSNEKGGPFPGMVIPSQVASFLTQTIQSNDKSPAPPTPSQATAASSPASTGFGAVTVSFGQTLGNAFASPFSQPPATFSQTTSPAFGSTSFGQPASTPAFSQSFAHIADESVTSRTSDPSTTPFGTPAPSVFRTSGIVPSGGAFGNLTSTPSAFRPAQGFGAFGSSSVTSTSPFVNPKHSSFNTFSTPVKPISAFGVGGSGPSMTFGTSPAGSTTPKFGTPSTPTASNLLGGSSLGTPSTPSPPSTTPLATPVPNAFSEYSGTGGFSAFAKTGKPPSFSELLRAQKDGVGDAVDNSKGPASSKQDKEEDLSFIAVPKPEEEEDHDSLPPTPSTHGTFDEEEEDHDVGDGNDEEGHDDASSFLSESFSEEAGKEQEEGEIEEESEEGDEVDSEGSDEGASEETPSRANTQSPAAIPLPSAPGSRESTPITGPTGEKKDSGVDRTVSESSKPPSTPSRPDPAIAAKPKSPTPVTIETPDEGAERKSVPSKTPPVFAKPVSSAIPTLFGKPIAPTGKPPADLAKPTTPSPSPPLFGKQASSENARDARTPGQRVLFPSVQAESTTPPGSPDVPEDDGPLPAPKAVGPSSGLAGFGWPGSRPARSSPLAGTPGEDSKASPSQATPPQVIPSLPKARPASPKTPFGQILEASSRQKPGISSFAAPAQGQGQTIPPVATPMPTIPLNPPQFGLSAQAPATPPPSFKPPTFGGVPASALPAGNAPFIMPSSATAGLSGKPVTGFAIPGATNVRTTGAPSQQFAQPGPRQPVVQTTFESSMQKECHNLCVSLLEEFEQLAMMAKAAHAMRTMCSRPAALTHSKEDLRDKTKWGFGDLRMFGALIKDLEKDVLAACRLKDEFIPLVRDAESNLLKAETRKEEIIRFSKAKADLEFTKMLKARTLNPDAAETQSQLRKQIRLINDRVEQLEAHLKSCKKKLEEHRKGRNGIKPPSLDTISRIYRNVDSAVESQAQQIDLLASRIAKLNVDEPDTTLRGTASSRHRPSRRDASISYADEYEEPEDASRPRVTPTIAASTAAALNAERSAMRLKKALLNARKTPLLNTQASQTASRVPTLDTIPGDVKPGVSGLGAPSGLPVVDLGGSLDSLQASEQENASENQRRSSRHFSHSKPAKLGKSHAPVPPSIASFNWGPLPKPKPLTALPFEIRPEAGSQKPSS